MMNKHLSALQYQAEEQSMRGEKGQTLLELVVAIAVAILVLGSLVFATITSLRNAQLAKNQAQATKLAQEGLETVRSLRDRNGLVSGTNPPATNFNDLWSFSFDCSVSVNNCHFIINSGTLKEVNSTDFENIPPFKRQILIEGSASDSKQITALVQWSDTTGLHESRLTTILRNTQ